MRLNSIQRLNEDAFQAARRFPLSLLSSILATMLAIYLVEKENFDGNLQLLHLLLTLALGIPLFFSIDIFLEKTKLGKLPKILGSIVGIFTLGLIYFSFPDTENSNNTFAPYIKYLIYNLALHLTVAFIPFLKKGKLESFWNYNKTLFIRIVLAVFFSQVISTGITLAFGAVTLLFDLKIDPKIYAEVYILTGGIFNTWYFLAGIPLEFELKEKVNYPNGLKIFTQFILIPLLLIYLTILYVYGGKIILTWDWPRGIVSYLIVAISVLGIFTNLLLFPYQKEQEGGWIKTFYKAFYFLLLPLTVLLFLAIGIRVEEYGLTVNRYIILLMGIWLLGISMYFILGFKSIKTIPISLAITMILASFGPWGMFSWSEKAQFQRLESILSQEDLFENGKIKNEVLWEKSSDSVLVAKSPLNRNTLDSKNLSEANSIIRYLGDYHGYESIYPWLSEETIQLFEDKSVKNPQFDKLIAESLGLTYKSYFEELENPEATVEVPFTFLIERSNPLSISGYDHLIYFNIRPDSEPETNPDFSFSNPTFLSDSLILTWKGHPIHLAIEKQFDHLVRKFGEGYHANISPVNLTWTQSDARLEVKILMEGISINRNAQLGDRINYINGTILIREIVKEKPVTEPQKDS